MKNGEAPNGKAPLGIEEWPIVLQRLVSLGLSEKFIDKANEISWKLATFPYANSPNADLAIRFAVITTRKMPGEGRYWKTLGVAYYRAEKWHDCVECMNLGIELSSNCDSADRFVLAMAYYRVGETQRAMRFYDYGVESMERFAPQDEELIRFRAEAAALLGKSLTLAGHPSDTESPP